MITIYYSNRLESLKNELTQLISSNQLNDPLYSEVILVEHPIMMEWLHIELAKFFGVSANINFFSSFDFIWNILNKSLWDIFPASILTPEIMSWVFMKILSEINSNDSLIADWSYIQQYLCIDINHCKCLQLSEKITDLFIKYFMYRQPLFTQQQKKYEKLNLCMQSWQIELWYLFLKEIDKKKLSCRLQDTIYEHISYKLKKNYVNLTKLPKRIFVWGMSLFSPILLEILQALESYVNIYIYCINPCRFFLIENSNYNFINIDMQEGQDFFQNGFLSGFRLNISDSQNVFFNNKNGRVNNSLLFSWSQFFQRNFYSLSCLTNINERSNFFKNPEDCLLHLLQNDILNNYSQTLSTTMDISSNVNDKFENIAKNRLLHVNDRSLTVHVCHSIQREIEVLHDNLLDMMLDDQLLLPHDIVVMAPKINDYISVIQSVFNHASLYGRYLPFTIIDSSISDIGLVSSIFLKLLDLPNIRCTTEEICGLLEFEVLSACFDIDKDSFKILNTWILKSGIRWSLDDDMFSKHIMDTVVNVQYTWKFGLTRMLLSYAIDNEFGPWCGILPYGPGANSMEFINLVAKLGRFLEKLKFWRDRLSMVYILEDWLSVAEEIIHDFFVSDFNLETEFSLRSLKNTWRQIITSGIQANYCKSVSIDILYRKLSDILYKKTINRKIFSGSIVFCNLSSMRSIPYKVVYLLGMNANVYPRRDTSLNFDLTLKYIFDLDNTWCSDCYLLLEALLAARKSFNISFVGYSMHNDTKYSPSVLVSELFEYIFRNFYYFNQDTKNISLLTMEWIYDTFWRWHTRTPFALENFIPGNRNQSFFKEWLPIINDNFNWSELVFLCDIPSLSISDVSLNILYDFYNHPVRMWFQYRLKIYIQKFSEIPVDEPFFVDIHSQYQICRSLICSFLNNEDINVLYNRVRVSGMLPYGSFGDVFWFQQCQNMLKLSQIIKRYYISDNTRDVPISLTFKNIHLSGILSTVQENGLLRWKPRILSMRDGLLLWLEHLVYCAIGGEGDSYIFGVKSYWHFRALSSVEAKEYLLFLIFGYIQGINVPLLLFSHIGGCWLRHCFDTKTKDISSDVSRQYEARCKLIEAWENNQYIYGENFDPYIKKLVITLNDENIESIISAAKNYFLLPMKFNVSDILHA